jgi:hypothetical protein
VSILVRCFISGVKQELFLGKEKGVFFREECSCPTESLERGSTVLSKGIGMVYIHP